MKPRLMSFRIIFYMKMIAKKLHKVNLLNHIWAKFYSMTRPERPAAAQNKNVWKTLPNKNWLVQGLKQNCVRAGWILKNANMETCVHMLMAITNCRKRSISVLGTRPSCVNSTILARSVDLDLLVNLFILITLLSFLN